MKKLTAKQRSEIYLKVAERVFSDCDDDVFLCCFLTDEYKIITRIKEYPVEYVFNLFDEFSLFSPEELETPMQIPCGTPRAFFGHDDNARITCMLLCHEMSKD